MYRETWKTVVLYGALFAALHVFLYYAFDFPIVMALFGLGGIAYFAWLVVSTVFGWFTAERTPSSKTRFRRITEDLIVGVVVLIGFAWVYADHERTRLEIAKHDAFIERAPASRAK